MADRLVQLFNRAVYPASHLGVRDLPNDALQSHARREEQLDYVSVQVISDAGAFG